MNPSYISILFVTATFHKLITCNKYNPALLFFSPTISRFTQKYVTLQKQNRLRTAFYSNFKQDTHLTSAAAPTVDISCLRPSVYQHTTDAPFKPKPVFITPLSLTTRNVISADNAIFMEAIRHLFQKHDFLAASANK